jgi:hypothetical protein
MAETKNRTVGLELTTANQNIYTVPANYEAEIDNIYINNASSSEVTFSLDWYDAQNTTYYTLAETVKLPANSLLQINDNPFWLFKSDILRGLASANSAVTITVKIKETYLPQRS